MWNKQSKFPIHLTGEKSSMTLILIKEEKTDKSNRLVNNGSRDWSIASTGKNMKNMWHIIC